MDRWASLYLVACTMLADENLAGDLLLRARDEAHLEEMLRQRGELPPVLPAPTPAALEHVAYLRRRGRRRRMLTAVWVAALLLAVAFGGLGLVLWGDAFPAVRSVYAEPAIAQDAHGDLVLRVHRAEAGPGAVTIWWSLAGPGMGLNRNEPAVTVGFLERFRGPEEHQTTIRRVNRDLVHGKTVVAEVLDRPAEGQLALTLENRRFHLRFAVDRAPLVALERRIPVRQIMSRGGVGVLVQEIVQGPGYTRVVYEPWQAEGSPFRLLAAPAAIRVASDSGEVPVIDPTLVPWRLGPIDAAATELQLFLDEPIRVEANLRLPLRVGEKEPHSGLRVAEVKEIQPGLFQVILACEGPVIGVETYGLTNPIGYITFARRGHGLVLQGGCGGDFFIVHRTGEISETEIYLKTLLIAPPEGIRVEL